MGQYVQRGGKTYYKADDGKLYSNFATASSAQAPTLAEQMLGMEKSVVKPFANQLSNLFGNVGSGIASGVNQLTDIGRAAYAVVDPQAAQDAALQKWLETGATSSRFSTERQGPPVPDRIRNAPAAPVLPPPQGASLLSPSQGAPGQRTVPIVRSEDDQYRQLLSQYSGLQKAKKYEEAGKLGMEIWQKKYGGTPMGQPGGAVGARNPLMEKMFGYQAGASTTNPSYAGSTSGSEDFAMAANAVPAPWNQQGIKVSSDFSGVVPFQAAKTTGEGMPAFQTTGEKTEEFLRNVKLSNLF